MKHHGKQFSLFISGQILSRVPESEYGELISWLKSSKKNFQEIVIATKKNEVNYEIKQLIDRLVIVSDTGPDIFKGKNQSNHSRQLAQIIPGLTLCTAKYVFKTRVEFYKMSQEIIGTAYSKNLFDLLEKTQVELIIPAPGTLSAQKNGCPLFLSDTMIIAKKEDLLRWYKIMENDYLVYKNFWYRGRRIFENIAFEQILGLAVIQDFVGSKIKPKEAKRLNKIQISKNWYRAIEKYFAKKIMLFNPNILEIRHGRFLNMREDYISKPLFINFENVPFLLFKYYGVKYSIRKLFSKNFRRFISYNGKNSLRSILSLRSLR